MQPISIQRAFDPELHARLNMRHRRTYDRRVAMVAGVLFICLWAWVLG